MTTNQSDLTTLNDSDLDELLKELTGHTSEGLSAKDTLSKRAQSNYSVTHLTKIFPTTSTPNNLTKGTTFTWRDVPKSKEDKPAVHPFDTVIGLRGYLVSVLYSYSLFEAQEDDKSKDAKVNAPICSLTKAKLGEYIYPYSPTPLSKWQKAYGGNEPTKSIIQLDLHGSRGKSCADCIRDGENVNISSNPNIKKSSCSVAPSFIFLATEFYIKRSDKLGGNGWVKPSELEYDGEANPYTNSACIPLYIKTNASLDGSSGKPSIYVFNAPEANIQTQKDGIKFIPDDVQFLAMYWENLLDNGQMKFSTPSTKLPYTPLAPLTPLVQTEVYLSPLTNAPNYATSALVFRTSETFTENPSLIVSWGQAMTEYINTIDKYMTENNLTLNDFVQKAEVAVQTPQMLNSSPEVRQVDVDVFS
jgi:hypothetical protein